MVKSDGTVWFTDPAYFTSLQPGQCVYRFDPAVGNASVVVAANDTLSPNGLCFSPDETKLYVSDFPLDLPSSRCIRVYDVLPDNTLTNSRVFLPQTSDGMRVDATGRAERVGRPLSFAVVECAGSNPDCHLRGALVES